MPNPLRWSSAPSCLVWVSGVSPAAAYPSRFPRQGILIFGFAELGIAIFGLSSLHIFRWAATYSAGANLPSVTLFSLVLLLIPTVLMGATLPILVEHLVRRSGHVGASVSRLYFVNTLGSAIACYLCATFLLRKFGQAGSVSVAACLNTLVGGIAYLYGRHPRTASSNAPLVSALAQLPRFSGPEALFSITYDFFRHYIR